MDMEMEMEMEEGIRSESPLRRTSSHAAQYVFLQSSYGEVGGRDCRSDHTRGPASPLLLQRRLQEALDNKDIDTGRHLHALIFLIAPLSSSLIDPLVRLFSASSRAVFDASLVFCSASHPSAHAWHSIIGAHFRLRQFTTALGLYLKFVLLDNHDASISPLSSTISLAIKSCAHLQEVLKGRIIHHHLIEQGSFESHGYDNVSLNCSLVYMYARFGIIAEARSLFELIRNKSLMSWNVMISGYVYCEDSASALNLFDRMNSREAIILPDNVTLSCALKACSMIRDVDRGMKIHRHIIITDCGNSHDYVANALIDMYAKHGSLEEAKHIFFKLLGRNSSVLWNTMISGFILHGHSCSALDLFVKMQDEVDERGRVPTTTTLSCILKACSNLKAVEYGHLIHGLFLEHQDTSDVVLISSLLDMYVKCGKMEDAYRVFVRCPRCCRNQVTWCVMIDGCVHQGCDVLALELVMQMLDEEIEPDDAMYSCLLKACGLARAIMEGKLLHTQIVVCGRETNGVIGSALIDMYTKFGSLDDGIKVFQGLRDRDVVCWNTIIAAHMQREKFSDALQLFEIMHKGGVKPDRYICSCMLKVFANMKNVEQGKYVHDEIIRNRLESDEVLWVSLIDMYAKCGKMQEANHIFHNLKEKNRVAWAALITGYALHGDILSAFKYFHEMQEKGVEPDETLMLCLLKTCSGSRQVRHIHRHIMQSKFDSQIDIANALVNVYQKTGNLFEAHKVFDGIPNKDVVSWNTIISGYVENQLNVSAFGLYEKMQKSGLESDTFTFSCMLKACWQMVAVDQGNLIYEHIIKEGLEQDAVIKRTVIEMYARCGSLSDARKVFLYFLPFSDASLWDAIIAANAQYSDWKMMTDLLNKMQEEGLTPSESTHVNVLTAYAHSGLFEDGKIYFESLQGSSGRVNIEHFNCAIDLFARSGHLSEAKELLQTMPIPPNVIGQTSFLSACKEHGNVKLGKSCFKDSILYPR